MVLLPLLLSAAAGALAASAPSRSSGAQFATPTFANPAAAAYAVDTSALPGVSFAMPTTWAGRMSISPTNSTTRELFFWYYPSMASGGSKDLAIWLNGGPGCSSLEGALEENGPIHLKQGGGQTPTLNTNAWTYAADMLYIEQPVGVGFDKGSTNITNESQLAEEVYEFLANFYDVFAELKAKKLTITGESYAGFYIPYIARRILHASAAEQAALPIDLNAILIGDGVYASGEYRNGGYSFGVVQNHLVAAAFAKTYQSILGISDSEVASLEAKAKTCGYADTLAQVTYPPKGPITSKYLDDNVPADCQLMNNLLNDWDAVNSCADIYDIRVQCPTKSDPIEKYVTSLATHLNVPAENWEECSNGYPFEGGNDFSKHTQYLFPGLLAKIPVYLWHGLDDAILIAEGDRVMIQNMTWNGAQGFQTAPTANLTVNGKAVGIKHTERNLTYIEVDQAGHMIPQDQPEVALHVIKAVLGQVAL